MIKRLNYTDRSRIARNAVKIVVHEGEPRTFTADLNLDADRYDADARIYIEATSTGSPAVMRFDFGTVGEPAESGPRELTDISGERLLFSVKLVDTRERLGRLVALAEGIRPEGDGDERDAGRMGLLPVVHADLGQQVWRLMFDAQDATLLVNRNLPGIARIARSHGGFFALVYPECVRQVLERVLIVERRVEVELEDHSWPNLWLRFGIHWHPEQEQPPPVPDVVDEGAQEEIDRWLEEITRHFCEHFHTLERFREAMPETEDES